MIENFSETLLVEYKRPWKLFTFVIGLSLLIVGSFYYKAPDWDIPISIIMASLSYLTASWSLHVLTERQWSKLPLMLFIIWFCIDGSYAIYWYFKDPVALALMRDVNFLASLSLYLMCALVWYYEGTMKQAFSLLKKTQKRMV
ncbi:hypothetical protein OO007_07410 [Cocleimonas sp. KMM 6892]|uniref:hypothetical protein n=1 Tax=unclassified Cocleimonas TaxID=2639732 RepID=UPI002DBE0107|nr:MULTISPECIES: hypothetical protein [unclassified Cocleimonas]MEB8432051.1 hypothetical protein [Cocleimonas sp. KMM 6892]MEC4714863.1 hypothetical protein [Cocleimonas sp. KMM 6895]MEC4744323.1 hypothetical protein [Cocleimonas sp. KMM 6896]